MVVATLENNNLILSIPKDMLSDKLIQKVIRMIEFKNLTQNNTIAEKRGFCNGRRNENYLVRSK
jgi:hypothetical protein